MKINLPVKYENISTPDIGNILSPEIRKYIYP